MKYFITLLALSAACLFVTGCESIEYMRLEKYTMHGNDTIVPTKPVKDPKYIKEFPARQAFKAVPNDILNKYYDKIPEDTRKYNLAKQNSYKYNVEKALEVAKKIESLGYKQIYNNEKSELEGLLKDYD